MKLLGLLFDPAYYSASTPELAELGENFERAFEHYSQHYAAACAPPNAYLAEHRELLRDTVGKCLLSDWHKNEIAPADHELINAYVTYLNAKSQLSRITASLKWHAAQDPSIIEGLLGIRPPIDIFTIKILEWYPQHQVAQKTIDFCLADLRTKPPLAATFGVFSNYVANHAPSSPHAVALIEATRSIDCTIQPFMNAGTCVKVAEQLAAAVEAGREFQPEVFEQFGLWIEELSRKNFNKLDGWALKFLSHGFMRRAYEPTQAIVEQLQALLPAADTIEVRGRGVDVQLEERTRIKQSALTAIAFGLEQVIDRFTAQNQTSDQVTSGLGFIDRTVEFLLQRDQTLSLPLIDAIIDFFTKYNHWRLDTVTTLLEHCLQVPGAIWTRLIYPMTYLRDQNVTHTQQAKFILKMLSAYGLPVPGVKHDETEEVIAIDELLYQAGVKNQTAAAAVSELLDDYKIPAAWQDRRGRNFTQILNTLQPAEWRKAVWQLYRDNNFFVAYSHKELISEFERLNVSPDSSKISVELRAITEQLASIAKVEAKSFYKISLSIGQEPTAIKRKTIHVYISESDGGRIFYKLRKADGSAKKLLLIGLSEVEQVNLESVLRDTLSQGQPCLDLGYIHRATELNRAWMREDFIRWRQSISFVSESNLSEVVAVLKQAMHLAGFKGRHVVRDAQTLALLILFADRRGRLAQVGTGEGKTEIIAMFAALQVLQGHTVDILTSASDLARRDAIKMKSFYEMLGMSSGHLIRTDGISEAQRLETYKADVVYGEAMVLIGDTLSDISRMVKHGRIFDVLVIDELDSHALDKRGMRIRNSGQIPGFEHLQGVFIYGLGHLKVLTQISTGNEAATLLATPNITHPGEPGSLSVLNISYNAFLSDALSNYTRNELLGLDSVLSERRMILPRHLAEFIPCHVPAWVKSAMIAAFEYRQDHHYIIRPKNWIGSADRQFKNNISNSAVNSARIDSSLEDSADFTALFNEHIVVPMDFQNTGEPQYMLQWSNGLHQFLQVMHSIGMTSESLVSSFMSYVSHTLKYGQVYGLTGTLGTSGHQAFLKQIYGIDSKLIPSFVKKRLAVFDSMLIEGEEETLDAVVEEAIACASQQRAVLIVTPLLKDAMKIAATLRERIAKDLSMRERCKVLEYGDGSSIAAVKDTLQPRTFVVSTNQGGRGADFQISREVEAAGGLHVILSSFQPSSRAQIQALGRVARREQFGSGRMIINIQDEYFYVCGYDLQCRDQIRNEAENTAMQQAATCEAPYTLLHDKLFDSQIWLIRKAESRTGYEITLPQTDSTNAPEQREIQLIISEANVFLFITWKQNALELDITALLKAMSETTYRQTLSLPTLKSKNLAFAISGAGFQLLHFLAAYHGFDFEKQAIMRTARAYERLWINEHQTLNRQVDGLDPREQAYLEKVRTTQDSLELVKLRLMYQAWQDDCKIYNKDLEVQQVKDLFAIWLNQQDSMLQRERSGCDSSTNARSAVSQERFQLVRAWALGNFSSFASDIAGLVKADALLTNPAYLVRHALSLQSIAFHQSQQGFDTRKRTASDRIDALYMLNEVFYLDLDVQNFQLFGTYPFLEKTPKFTTNKTASLQSAQGAAQQPSSHSGSSWWNPFFVLSDLVSAAASTAEYARISASKTLASAWHRAASYSHDWLYTGNRMIRGQAIFMSDPLQDAINNVTRATHLEPSYNFPAYQAISYLRVIQDSPSVYEANEDGMAEAHRINSQFFSDASNAQSSLVQHYMIPRQTKLMYAIINGMTNSTAPLTVSIALELKVFDGIRKLLQNAMDTVQSARQNQVVRIRRGIPLKEFMSTVKLTADDLSGYQRKVYEASGGKSVGLGGIVVDTLAMPNATNSTNSTEANATRLLSKDLASANALNKAANQPEIYPQSIMQELMINGVVLFEVELFTLAKPDKNWLGTILSGVFGLVQIVVGITLMIGGGPFATIFGQSLIFGGIMDEISVINSIRTGTPIPVGAYLQAKGISLAIGLTVASLGALGTFGEIAVVDASKVVSEFLPKALAQATIVHLATTVIAERLQKIVESNDGSIENMIDRKLNEFMHAHLDELTRIMVSDIWLSGPGALSGIGGGSSSAQLSVLSSMPSNSYAAILSQTAALARRHARKFHNPAANYVKGVVAGSLGMALSGGMYGFGAAMANVGVNAAAGLVEASEATDDVLKRLGDFVSARVSLGSRLMMLASLQKSFPTQAGDIMAAIDADGFMDGAVTGGAIDYQHCSRIDTLPALASFNELRPAIRTICDQINGLYSGHSARDRASSLRISIRGILLGQMHSVIHTNFGQPLASMLGEAAWKFTLGDMQKQYEDKLNKQATRDEQLRRMQAAVDETQLGAAKKHKIRSGETLTKIAKRHKVSSEALLAANPQIKDPNLIIAGRSLNIPVRTQTEYTALLPGQKKIIDEFQKSNEAILRKAREDVALTKSYVDKGDADHVAETDAIAEAARELEAKHAEFKQKHPELAEFSDRVLKSNMRTLASYSPEFFDSLRDKLADLGVTPGASDAALRDANKKLRAHLLGSRAEPDRADAKPLASVATKYAYVIYQIDKEVDESGKPTSLFQVGHYFYGLRKDGIDVVTSVGGKQTLSLVSKRPEDTYRFVSVAPVPSKIDNAGYIHGVLVNAKSHKTASGFKEYVIELPSLESFERVQQFFKEVQTAGKDGIYSALYANCIEIGQRIHTIAGLPGDPGDYIAKHEFQRGNLATKFFARQGFQGEPTYVTSPLSAIEFAKSRNLPIDRVIALSAIGNNIHQLGFSQPITVPEFLYKITPEKK